LTNEHIPSPVITTVYRLDHYLCCLLPLWVSYDSPNNTLLLPLTAIRLLIPYKIRTQFVYTAQTNVSIQRINHVAPSYWDQRTTIPTHTSTNVSIQFVLQSHIHNQDGYCKASQNVETPSTNDAVKPRNVQHTVTADFSGISLYYRN